MDIEQFVEGLSQVADRRDVENPYRRETCKTNLANYLNHIQESGFDVMLIGEAPGYLGCARTGIPFTDEVQLYDAANAFALGLWERSLSQEEVSEKTASEVWRAIREHRVVPLMWNIFPFHPHEVGNLKTNRQPTAQELREGLAYAEALLSLFDVPGDKVFAVGRKAQRALELDEDHYLRHPSHGGSLVFSEHFAGKVKA